MERIPIAGPWITEREVEYVADAAANGWYGQANQYQERFERAMADYVGVKYAISLPSCTSAIHLAFMALGIGPGDEVLVPDVTWIASAAPLSYVGATPVFVDMDPDNWCVSLAGLEQAITPRTKAIVVVDLYGHMPDLPAIRSLASLHRLGLIEDAAEAFGSELLGQRAGSWGDIGVFSFHGTKTITTGEGGMLVTDRVDLHDRVQFLRDHGRKPGDRSFFHSAVAHKYKMSGVQAALGLGQVERAEEIVARKRKIFSWYQEEFAGDARVTLNPDQPDLRNSYWMSTILLDPALGLEKTELIGRLAERGIDSRPFFFPLSSLPAYAGTEAARRGQQTNHVARRLTPLGVNLPSALSLTRDQVGRVGMEVRSILDEVARGHRRAA